MNFENFTGCKRGDQPYGTLEKSAEQAHSGSFSGKLSYSFPTVKDNYVVFLCGAKISGQPPSLSVWVRGDGGDHFLNAWVRDSQNEVRSFTFGRVPNTGQWVELTAPLDTAAGWPAGHISGPDNGKLDLPISLYALVLDGVPDGGGPFQGVLYLDDLATSDAVARSQPAASTNPGRTGGAAPTTPAAAAVSTVAPQPPSRPPLTGHITYTCNEGGVLGVCALDVATKNTWRVHAYAHQGRIRGDGRVLMDGVGGGKDNLLNVALDGSHDIVMSAHPEDTYPDWSPSGVSAVFHSTQQGDRKDRIYIQGDTSAMQEPSLMHAGAADLFGQYPTWLDNWRIAFTGCDYWASGSNCGIYTTDSKGDGIPARVTDNPADRSSDGRGGTLLFSSPRNGNWEVYAIPYGGGNPQNLTNNPSHDFGAAFSPSRGQIAFMSNRGGWSIWVMNADGSGATQLISVPGGFGANWAEERLSWGP